VPVSKRIVLWPPLEEATHSATVAMSDWIVSL
jgi:hypothetical protein